MMPCIKLRQVMFPFGLFSVAKTASAAARSNCKLLVLKGICIMNIVFVSADTRLESFKRARGKLPLTQK